MKLSPEEQFPWWVWVKSDFRVGNFYWLLPGKEYEVGMGRSSAAALKQGGSINRPSYHYWELRFFLPHDEEALKEPPRRK
jgi:hypothetical protein